MDLAAFMIPESSIICGPCEASLHVVDSNRILVLRF